MKSEMKKWFVTMLAVAAILTVGSAEAGYVQSGPDVSTVEDDPEDTQTSTMKEYTDVDTHSLEDGECHCYVKTLAWAKAVDAALADASGTAYWEISWEWEGPPSTPAGGTLSWDIDALGYSDASGTTDPGDGGSAYSEAECDSGAWLARNAGMASGGAYAEGSVEDNEPGEYGGIWYGDATLIYQDAGRPTGQYWRVIVWQMWQYDDDTIASGTSYVHVLAGAYADGSSLATASGSGSDAEAKAVTVANVTAYPDASFESN